MIRGTTPPLTFTLPFDVSEALKVWITFSQNNKEIFTVEKDDLEINEKTIKCVLTQKQTLALTHGAKVEMQIRVLLNNENMEDALASEIITAPVQRILKEGEI